MNFDFEKIYESYPRRQGKKLGLERCKRFIKTEKQYSELIRAIDNYSRYCSENNLEVRFVKLFATFMNEYEDWTDDRNGSLNLAKQEDKFKNETLRILRDK